MIAGTGAPPPIVTLGGSHHGRLKFLEPRAIRAGPRLGKNKGAIHMRQCVSGSVHAVHSPVRDSKPREYLGDCARFTVLQSSTHFPSSISNIQYSIRARSRLSSQPGCCGGTRSPYQTRQVVLGIQCHATCDPHTQSVRARTDGPWP